MEPSVAVELPPAAAPAETASPSSFPGQLALLAIGIVLGAVAGLILLIAQGQRQARADLEPVIRLEQQAWVQGDADLYRSLLDPADPDWGEAMVATLNDGIRTTDDDTTPRVRRVYLQGERAEVEVEFAYGGRPYRRLEALRRVENGWRLARPSAEAVAMETVWEGERLILRAASADAFLAAHGPRLEALAAAFCARYRPPSPCRIELNVVPDGELLPFRPGMAARPMPPLVTYQAARADDRVWITLGVGREAIDPVWRDRIRRSWPRLRGLRQLQVTEQSPPEAATTARVWLQGPLMPVRVVSPRYVGVHDGDPHPLWWLAVAETMGDVVLRRALGPVTGESAAVLTLWAAARGDVAVWAERFTGVRLPPADVRLYLDEADAIGLSVWRDTTGQRAAARAFALLLHVRYGETAFLDWVLGHDEVVWTAEAPQLAERTPAQLAGEWQAWVDACQVQGRCALGGELDDGR
ncbi:MAG: hypothetical protein NZP34_11925 [Caldilineales bacterium]|nr:hypothetical protein [Caldilineales bacterium]MCX7852338.1 hypothetical protein [Caldilineales bacterium]